MDNSMDKDMMLITLHKICVKLIVWQLSQHRCSLLTCYGEMRYRITDLSHVAVCASENASTLMF